MVNSLDDVDDAGGCNDEHCSLREAIAFASPGATITFSVTGTITLGGSELLIEKNLTISGPGARKLAVSGNGISRVFLAKSATTAHLSGLTIQNSTISGNTAGGAGGGIYKEIGTLLLTIPNSTVSGNTAADGGGVAFSFSPVDLSNSIHANNTGGDCKLFNTVTTDPGYNLVRDGSCISAATSRSGDPLLGPLTDNGGPTWTHALLHKSPAIDAIPFGSNGCGISTDQRGVERPQIGACDIGAFEFARGGGKGGGSNGGGPKK
ncbi:MAG: CSLREA domain-containing protein [Gemmatimonadetes bacterium]|nr:CSLREA domain-containing protein [Gemmatimonadota bacterium]